MAFSDDDQQFVKILKAMGIEEFDSLVPVALNEYAARFAAEILQDAKDYSSHAGRSEIQPEDVKLAVKLSDSNMTNSDARESIAGRVRDHLAKMNITELADRASVLHRYPADMFMQRSHTYIPGCEAYTEEDEADNVEEMEVETAGNASSGGNGNNLAAPTSLSSAVKFTPGARTAAKRLDQAAGFEMEE